MTIAEYHNVTPHPTLKVVWSCEPEAPSTNAQRGWKVREQWEGSSSYTQYGPVETEEAALLLIEIRQREVSDVIHQIQKNWLEQS